MKGTKENGRLLLQQLFTIFTKKGRERVKGAQWHYSGHLKGPIHLAVNGIEDINSKMLWHDTIRLSDFFPEWKQKLKSNYFRDSHIASSNISLMHVLFTLWHYRIAIQSKIWSQFNGHNITASNSQKQCHKTIFPKMEGRRKLFCKHPLHNAFVAITWIIHQLRIIITVRLNHTPHFKRQNQSVHATT